MQKRVSYDGIGFSLDGKRFIPYSGEMHHYRVHPDLWKDRFLRMKAGFMNCTGAYFYWGAIEPLPGEFNFKEICDLERYFKLAAEVGLLIIPRPGGYICAETENGGHPVWIYNTVSMPRSLESVYIEATERYYTEVNKILRHYDIEKGDLAKNIFMYQVENEMFSREVEGGNVEYHNKLRDIVLKTYGDSVPIFTNENRVSRGTEVFDTIDFYPNPWDTKGAFLRVREMLKQQPNFPCFGMEIEGGWFSAFGFGEESLGYSYRGNFPAEWTEFLVKQLLGAGMSGLNYYMYHGGTNFGYWGSKYMTTTYDYGAPISEWGGLSPRFYVSKLIGGFLKSFGHLLAEMPPDDNFIEGSDTNKVGKQSEIYALVRAKGRAGFIFVYNEAKFDQHYPVVLKDAPIEEAQFEPLQKLSLTGQSAKIIPYQIPIATGVKIVFSTLEPYLLCKIDDNHYTLLFHGQSGEAYYGCFELNGVRQEFTGLVRSNEDQFWLLDGGKTKLLIGIVETARAERTWLLDVDGRQLPIISNTYLLYDYEKDVSGNIRVEIQHPINAGTKLSLPWFITPSEFIIDGVTVPVIFHPENGVGTLTYCSNLYSELLTNEECRCAMNAHTINLGESDWASREEPLKAANIEGFWREWHFNEPLEEIGFYKPGYRIYRTTFMIPEDRQEYYEHVVLHLPGVIDNACIVINNQFAGYIEQYGNLEITELVTVKGMNQLYIFTECIGHYNHGYNEVSGILGGVYLDFGSGALLEDEGPFMMRLVDWKIRIDPERTIYDINTSMTEVQPSFSPNDEDWDEIKILPAKHAGVGWAQGWQLAFYHKKVKIPVSWQDKAVSLEFQRLRGMAWVFVNGAQVAEYSLRHESSRTKHIEKTAFDVTPYLIGDQENSIVVIFYMREGGDGIWDGVCLRALDLRAGNNWAVSAELEGDRAKWFELPLKSLGDEWRKAMSVEDLPNEVNSLLWVKTNVKIPKTDHLWLPRYLDLSHTPGKCNIWWNGFFLGRYWDIGPQTKFYIPEPIIKEENEVTLLFNPLGKPLEKATAPLVKPYGVFRKSEWSFRF